jgi:hypothetical protein
MALMHLDLACHIQAGMGPEDVVLYFGVIDFLQVW